MTVGRLVQSALISALRSNPELSERLTGIFDAPPGRGAIPLAMIEPPVVVDWGASGVEGSEIRATATIRTQGESPERTQTLAGHAEHAIRTMPRALAEGWSVASVVLVRNRIQREGERRWAAMIDIRVRSMRAA